MEKERTTDNILTYAQVFRECTQYKYPGFVRLIRSPLNFKEERSNYDDCSNYYFYFNYHKEHGRYRYEVDESMYNWTYIGKPYYLALLADHRGKMRVVNIYDGSYDLDETLTQRIEEDVDLTGEEISWEEEAKREYIVQQQKLAEMKFTPEEEKANEPERNRLAKKSMCYLLVGVVMTAALFWSEVVGDLWQSNKFLLVLFWLCGCVWPVCKYFVIEAKFANLISRMSARNQRSAFDKFRLVLWIVTVFANIYLGAYIFGSLF